MDWLHLGFNLGPWCLIKNILQDIMAILDEIISNVDPLVIAKKIIKEVFNVEILPSESGTRGVLTTSLVFLHPHCAKCKKLFVDI
jgi:hypothetical protein